MIKEYIQHILFPTPVYQNKIPVENNLLTEIQKQSFERMPAGNGYFTVNKNILPDYPKLKSKIQEHVDIYAHEMMKLSPKYELPIINSWANMHVEGDEAQLHSHSNALISGVYYMRVPKDSGEQIVFTNYNYSTFMNNIFNVDLTERNHINSQEYWIDVEDGDIVLFPSHVKHRVPSSKTKEKRYSLAFNVWISGTLGKGIDELHL